jgi:hypothetical protein
MIKTVDLMKPDSAWSEAASWSKHSTGEVKKKLLHRTGIEPVPLAWKASMITTSPSVFYFNDCMIIYII